MNILSKEKKNNVLFVSTELDPFAKVGGMGSVMHSLPHALQKLGYDARVIIPRYLNIGNEENITMEYEGLGVPTDDEQGSTLICNVKKYIGGTEEGKPLTAYFLENMEYYEQRANVYGYADDPVRWALLCRGALEFIKVSQWVPDVIICSDWQTGFLSNYLKTVYKDDARLSKISTIFSIHNLAYQGNFNHRYLQDSEYDDGRSPVPGLYDPKLLKINGMRRGIIYSDLINTVSPTYAREIMTAEYGEGMQAILREKKAAVFGILNGIDYSLWDSANDPLIAAPFTSDTIEQRAVNKQAIQSQFNLDQDQNAFLVAIVSRLTPQKGFDLLTGRMLKSLLKELNMQLIVVGEGEEKYMELFQGIHEKFASQVGIELRFDHTLPHTVFAGADAVLIPSLFEPSGLTQMEAMHYGAVPIVRKTGGLADTVTDYSPNDTESTGFVFEKFDSLSFLISIVRAYENFKNKGIWQSLQQSAMKKDFSWENSAKEYDTLIQKSLEMHHAQLG